MPSELTISHLVAVPPLPARLTLALVVGHQVDAGGARPAGNRQALVHLLLAVVANITWPALAPVGVDQVVTERVALNKKTFYRGAHCNNGYPSQF